MQPLKKALFAMAALGIAVDASVFADARVPKQFTDQYAQANTTTTARPTLETAFQAEMTPAERAALNRISPMLVMGKLGGVDRIFNHADLDAVVEALMQDGPGLSREVQAKLRADGDPNTAEQVRAAFAGESFGGAFVRDSVITQARPLIKAEIAAIMDANHVDRKTAISVDRRLRTMTFAELRKFEGDLRVFAKLLDRVKARTGSEVRFPKGLAKGAIDFLIEGKTGLPPGAVVVVKG